MTPKEIRAGLLDLLLPPPSFGGMRAGARGRPRAKAERRGLIVKKKLVLLFALAIAATLFSSFVKGSAFAIYPDSEDCQRGCDFAAGGWPLQYIVDEPGLSPAGSVSLTNALLGLDNIRVGYLLGCFVFWIFFFGAMYLILKKIAFKQR